MKRIIGITLLILLIASATGFTYIRFFKKQSVTDFGIINKNGKPHLVWTATARPNVRTYIVEKSNDGITFTSIDTINAVFNTRKPYRYLVAEEKAEPAKYYRLCYTDEHLNKFVSTTISVRHKTTSIALGPASESE
jgi:hypothetical protein